MKAEFRNGRIEARFDGKPSPQVRGELKRRGFWWDGAAGCWWLARPVELRFVRNDTVSQDGTSWALDYLQYLGMVPEERAAIVRASDAWCHQQGARGMELACGIA